MPNREVFFVLLFSRGIAFCARRGCSMGQCCFSVFSNAKFTNDDDEDNTHFRQVSNQSRIEEQNLFFKKRSRSTERRKTRKHNQFVGTTKAHLMTESEPRAETVSNSSTKPSNSNGGHHGGGRSRNAHGRGRGPGRGGGRHGRGRGRSSRGGGGGRKGRGGGGRSSENNHEKKEHDNAKSEEKKNDIATSNNEQHPSVEKDGKNDGIEQRSGGRGGGGRGRGGRGRGRSSGRGRGRGRGGRKGGRGGRGHHNKNPRSSSPVPETESNNAEVAKILEDGNDLTDKTEYVESIVEDKGVDEEEKGTVDNTTMSPALETDTRKKELSLPPPPKNFDARGGVPMILSRHNYPPSGTSPSVDYDSEAQQLSERLAAAALEGSFGHEEEKKEVVPTDESSPAVMKSSERPPKKKKSKKKKDKAAASPPAPAEEEVPAVPVSTTAAIASLKGQEVSIDLETTVKMSRTDSSASIDKADLTSTKKTGTKKKGRSKKKALSKDDAVNQRAAKAFNKSVRACIERSDPDHLREILHDKRNHNFALDKTVLEQAMKAYVMAAMFDDALYCLRNCALPGTLATMQTERILTCMPQNMRNSSAYTAADMINQLCIATEFDNPLSRSYFGRIVRGISLEFLEEVMSARDRICSAPCERLVRAAVCVVNCRLKRGKKPTELVVSPGDQLGVFVPDSMENRGIQAGDAVSILPYAGPYPMSAESLDRNMIEATVTNTNPMVLRLQDKTNATIHAMLTEQIEGNVYRIDKLANRMGFNRQLSAAVAIASPLGDSKTRDFRRPSPQLINAITAMDENIELERVTSQHEGYFRGQLTSTAALCSQVVPWNYEDDSDDGGDQDSHRMTSQLALDKYGALEGLNASQRLAVEGAATNRLTLVQGPPGTGKFDVGAHNYVAMLVSDTYNSFTFALCR